MLINATFNIGPYFKICLSFHYTYTILANALRLHMIEGSIIFEGVNGANKISLHFSISPPPPEITTLSTRFFQPCGKRAH